MGSLRLSKLIPRLTEGRKAWWLFPKPQDPARLKWVSTQSSSVPHCDLPWDPKEGSDQLLTTSGGHGADMKEQTVRLRCRSHRGQSGKPKEGLKGGEDG